MSARCLSCGEGEVRLAPSGPREEPYRGMTLTVPAGLAVATCSACGEEFWSPDDVARLQAVLQPLFRAACASLAVQSLDLLKAAGVAVMEVERVLDLSPGYLSKVRAGSKGSSTLTATLALLAAESCRVQELAEMWRSQSVSSRDPAAPSSHYLLKVRTHGSYTTVANVDDVGMAA